MKKITLKIEKTKMGYCIEYDKFVNIISYGPGENERITEHHEINGLGSSLPNQLKRIVKEELDK